MYPVLFSFGPITIYTFGIFFALAFLIGTFVIWHYGKESLKDETIMDFILITTVIALIGGRITYILSKPEIFEFNVLKMLHLFNFPGFSFSWALVIGIVSALIFGIKRKVATGTLLDIWSLGLAIAFTFGEVGCFFNGCLVGLPTKLPWGLEVIGKIGKRHPLAIYEIIFSVFLYILLTRFYLLKKEADKKIIRKEDKVEGNTAALFFLLFGSFQFLLEFLREGSVYWGNLKINQYMDLVIVAISFVCFSRYGIAQTFLILPKSVINMFKKERTI